MTTEHTDPDRVYSDDPKGADSSPMSELQRNALAAHTGPSEYQTVADELEQTDHMIVSCRKLLEALEGKYARLLGRLADLESKPGIPRQDVSTALAEHTQPALDVIERAGQIRWGDKGYQSHADLVATYRAENPGTFYGDPPEKWTRDILIRQIAIKRAERAEPTAIELAAGPAIEQTAPLSDPFAGIPNSSDEENRPL